MSGRFRAGVGRATITPPVGIAHAGWGAQVHERAEGIEDDFFATALAFEDDETSGLLIELDTGMVMLDEAAELRSAVSEATDVPTEAVRISYSHTHAGPLLRAMNVRAGNELVEPYKAALRAGIIGAARAAMLDRRPARIGATTTECRIAVNRRFMTPDGRVVVSQDPERFTDPVVTVGRIESTDGEPIAAVVGYACHPITLGFENRLLSPDFPGPTRQAVERLTGATCLFLLGAAGDQMPIEALTADTTVHRRLGTMLGASAASAWLGIDPSSRVWTFDRVIESGAPLGLRRASVGPKVEADVRLASVTVSMPLREASDAAAATAKRDEIRAELAELRAAGAPETDILDAMFRTKRAEIAVWFAGLYGGRDRADIELHGIRIGPLALVGFPGEPFARTGAAVRERSPFPVTLMGGYTNGWAGYVPTADEFPRGGYEVEIGSHFAAGAAEVLEDASVALLETLA